MSGRQYKSGFAKRKEKEKKDSEAEKGQSKMDSFGNLRGKDSGVIIVAEK